MAHSIWEHREKEILGYVFQPNQVDMLESHHILQIIFLG